MISKKIVVKVRNLSDTELSKVIEAFDGCTECWDNEPEKCELRPIRKKIGLGECYNYEAIQWWKKRHKYYKNTRKRKKAYRL